MPIDPKVSQQTLGHPHAKLGLDTVLAATRKLLAISRGEQGPDALCSHVNSNAPGTVEQRLSRRVSCNIRANAVVLRVVQRNVDSVSRSVDSISALSAGRSIVSLVASGLRPAPDRRTRDPRTAPRAAGWSNSRMPA
jgi:hypothetical protein